MSIFQPQTLAGQKTILHSQRIIDIDDTEAFLVRKAGDGGDIFVIDTTNSVVAIGGVTPVTGCRLILPQENDGVTPTLAFGDGDTGLYESADDTITWAFAGNGRYQWSVNELRSLTASGFLINRIAASGTVPAHSFTADTNTGIGRAAADQLSLITGGIGSYYKNAAGTTQRWCTQESVADSGKVVTMPTTSNGGIGFAQLGDGEEYALFTFTSAGAVTLIQNSGNVGTTEDNDTTFNIYDNGTNIGFNNELGGTKNLFVMLWYN